MLLMFSYIPKSWPSCHVHILWENSSRLHSSKRK